MFIVVIIQFVWNFQAGFVRTIYLTLQKLYVACRYSIPFFHLSNLNTWTLQTLEFHLKQQPFKHSIILNQSYLETN